MAPEDQRFPRWAGPIIGAGIGIVLGLRGMRRQGLADWTIPIVGALLGALGGGVLWLLNGPAGQIQQRASIVGTILALLAIFPGILPCAGLLFGIPAFLINRRAAGWQNHASRLGLGLCALLTIVAIAASQIPLR